jgi:hypothetical protein
LETLGDAILIYLFYRLILSNTEDLHAKIDELSERIRQLEEALASLQVSFTFLLSPRSSKPEA